MKPAKTQNLVSHQKSQPASAVNSAVLNIEDLKILRAPFTKDRLGVKVQSLSKDRNRALLVQYLQHTDVQDRLEEVDPAWTIEVLNEHVVGDTVYVRAKMTLKGVSRENVGEGSDPKAAYSDALKRCAMLFGIGRYLYDAPTVWADYDESRDRYRQWSVDDYEAAMNRRSSGSNSLGNGGATKKPPSTSNGAKVKPISAQISIPQQETNGSTSSSDDHSNGRPREELNRILLNLYRPYLTQFPQTQFAQLLKTRYEVAETQLMTVEQLEDLIQFMESKLQSVA